MPARIKPSGDQRALNISLRDCWADFGSGAAANTAFYKQGGNDLGLVVQGGRIGADYPRGVELSSGKALVQAVTFKSTATSAAGVYINSGAIDVQNLANTFSMTGANASLVSDQRDSEQYFDLARLKQKKFTLSNNAAGSMPLPAGKKGFGWVSITGVGGAAHFAWDTIGTAADFRRANRRRIGVDFGHLLAIIYFTNQAASGIRKARGCHVCSVPPLLPR